MVTRTSMSSPYRLRVADASAASSASKMISLSTPFSLETASTTIRISLFISRPPAARGSNVRRQVRLANSGDRQRPALPVHLDLDRLGARRGERPLEAPPALVRLHGLDEHRLADEPGELLRACAAAARVPATTPRACTAPGSGPRASSNSLTARLTRSQSSSVMPASASMYRRRKPLPRPGEYSSSQSS